MRVSRSNHCPRAVSTAVSISTISFALFGSANAASDDERPVEEVIVTAQKRVEKLQDVPISMSVLSGVELDKVTTAGVFEALGRVPGVVTTAPSNIGGGAQLTVRGVSAGGAQFNGSSPIAYYLDSVPFGLVKTAIVPDTNAYDLQRVEVLRGPQGTLYGASAQNGVVRVLTNDAKLDRFEIKARTGLSTTDGGGGNYRGDMAVNVPIVEGKFAARAVLGYEDMSGWIDKPNHKDVNDAEVRNARLKLNGQLTDQLSLGLLAWISRIDNGAPSAADDNHRRMSAADESISTDYDVYGLKLGYDASAFNITSMTSYIDYETDSAVDLLPFIGVSAVGYSYIDSTVVSEEINVSSTGDGPWRWSFGGIYRDVEDTLVQNTPFPPLPNFTDKSESFAIFGQITRLFWEGQFEVTAGVRYFEDDVTQIENTPQTLNPADAVLPPDKSTFDATSPRVVLAWHPAKDATIYASYAEGFRSGFNQNANVIRAAPEFPPLKSDNLVNYEIGAKGLLAGGRLSYDAAVFYMDWDDVQQTLAVLINGIPTSALVNGDSASGLGVEFSLMTQPLDGLELGLNFSWNDLTADSDLVTAGLSLYNEGDRLNFSPEYTAGLSASYAFEVSKGYDLRFAASGSYFSSQTYRNSLGPMAIVIDESDEQLTARATVSLDAPSGWTATAFVDNLTNEDSRGPGIFAVPDWTQRIRPRTMGLQLEFRF